MNKHRLILAFSLALTMCSSSNKEKLASNKKDRVSVINQLNARSIIRIDNNPLYSGVHNVYFTKNLISTFPEDSNMNVEFDLIPPRFGVSREFVVLNENREIFRLSTERVKISKNKRYGFLVSSDNEGVDFAYKQLSDEDLRRCQKACYSFLEKVKNGNFEKIVGDDSFKEAINELGEEGGIEKIDVVSIKDVEMVNGDKTVLFQLSGERSQKYQHHCLCWISNKMGAAVFQEAMVFSVNKENGKLYRLINSKWVVQE